MLSLRLQRSKLNSFQNLICSCQNSTLTSYKIFPRRCLPAILLSHLNGYRYPTIMRDKFLVGLKIGKICFLILRTQCVCIFPKCGNITYFVCAAFTFHHSEKRLRVYYLLLTMVREWGKSLQRVCIQI